MVELMITVAVAVLLVGIALPSFDTVFNSGRINGQANEMIATLQLARMEAIRRNARVVVCASANGTACSNTADWRGWIAFIDDGGFSHKFASGDADNAGNATVDANETVIRAGVVNPKVKVLTSGNISGATGGAISFSGDGMARDLAGNLLTGMISVCIPTKRPPQNIRDVRIAAGSRFGVSVANGAGVCNAPGNK